MADPQVLKFTRRFDSFTIRLALFKDDTVTEIEGDWAKAEPRPGSHSVWELVQCEFTPPEPKTNCGNGVVVRAPDGLYLPFPIITQPYPDGYLWDDDKPYVVKIPWLIEWPQT